MLLACLPFGPCVTSNETFCPSFRVLNPGILIAEKCAKRSSPPPSGVMKPNPLASLNHLTVPVAISDLPQDKLSAGGCPPHVSFSRTEKYEDRNHAGDWAVRALVLETKHLWEHT